MYYEKSTQHLSLLCEGRNNIRIAGMSRWGRAGVMIVRPIAAMLWAGLTHAAISSDDHGPLGFRHTRRSLLQERVVAAPERAPETTDSGLWIAVLSARPYIPVNFAVA